MKRTIIIAEAGVNHNGDIGLAKKLIDVAADAGVDYVKFQSFKAESLSSPDAKKAEYQKRNLQDVSGTGQLEMLKKLELSYDQHLELKGYCKEKNISFLSSPFDIESAFLLRDMGLEIFKVPSGELTNLPYLQVVGSFGRQVILSTGMADLGETEDALDILQSAGTPKENITVLHCNTEYPTPMEDVNLRAMDTILKAFNVKVGYSDHTRGIEIPIAAVALGAQVIEKHFTLDRNMPGPDHAASLEPDELKEMVRSIRNIEVALGDGIKKPSPSEEKNKDIARKSLHFNKDLPAGTEIALEDIAVKRPGNGIPPKMISFIVGRKVKIDIRKDAQIKMEDLG